MKWVNRNEASNSLVNSSILMQSLRASESSFEIGPKTSEISVKSALWIYGFFANDVQIQPSQRSEDDDDEEDEGEEPEGALVTNDDFGERGGTHGDSNGDQRRTDQTAGSEPVDIKEADNAIALDRVVNHTMSQMLQHGAHLGLSDYHSLR